MYDSSCLFFSQLLNESGPSNSSMQQKKGYFLLHFVTVDDDLAVKACTLEPFVHLFLVGCVCLGNDLGDEEIDIGGNGPPVSSYQPVEIEKEKDTGHKSSKISSDSSSGKKRLPFYAFFYLCFKFFVLYPKSCPRIPTKVKEYARLMCIWKRTC